MDWKEKLDTSILFHDLRYVLFQHAQSAVRSLLIFYA